jgi:hypothetical protein
MYHQGAAGSRGLANFCGKTLISIWPHLFVVKSAGRCGAGLMHCAADRWFVGSNAWLCLVEHLSSRIIHGPTTGWYSVVQPICIKMA